MVGQQQRQLEDDGNNELGGSFQLRTPSISGGKGYRVTGMQRELAINGSLLNFYRIAIQQQHSRTFVAVVSKLAVNTSNTIKLQKFHLNHKSDMKLLAPVVSARGPVPKARDLGQLSHR
ncbi:hypothetical protein M0804_008156 [Polistes exclamans]|nr:hypothetical protein M0804_008156 [Polistes exclamans]